MNLEQLIQEKKWQELISNFKPKQIAQSLSFLAGMQLTYDLLYNKDWDRDIQEFAIQILEKIRTLYVEEWNSSWRYDAFLGWAYYIVFKYDEKYQAFKRALEKTTNPPPQLLIAMASCCDCPGDPPVSYEQAMDYLKLALKDYLYVDGVSLMRMIYRFKRDSKNEKYWAEIFEKIKDQNKDSPSLVPDFIQEESSY